MPVLHVCACFISYVGLVIPPWSYLGIVWVFVMLVDFPISIPAYVLAWNFNSLAVTWILIAGTLWWYFLSHKAESLIRNIRTRRST
jgi:hypothetical protein